MKIRKILSPILALAFAVFSHSQADAQENDAIYAWVDGSATCYQLDEMPEVTYDGNYAVLSVYNSEVCRFDISGDKKLSVCYGIYIPGV